MSPLQSPTDPVTDTAAPAAAPATPSRAAGRGGPPLDPRAVPPHHPWQRPALAVGALALVAAPFLVGGYWTFLLSTWLAYTIAVMGARVLFGVSGQLSLAQATFVGIGAYSAAIGAGVIGLTALYEIALVLGVSVVAALVVGLPALRVSGLRLALVTLAFGELFQWWLIQQRDLTGGPQGLPVPSLFVPGVDTTDPLFLYGLCAVCAVAVTLVMLRLPRTQLGRNMAAVRESVLAAQSVGVPVVRTKLVAFVVSGVCAGLSGFLVAHVAGAVSPANYDLFSSVYILVGVILGGTGSTAGAWIGAAYVSLVPPLFASAGWDRQYVLLSGVLLVALIYLLPGGLVSLGRYLPGGAPRRRGAPAPKAPEVAA